MLNGPGVAGALPATNQNTTRWEKQRGGRRRLTARQASSHSKHERWALSITRCLVRHIQLQSKCSAVLCSAMEREGAFGIGSSGFGTVFDHSLFHLLCCFFESTYSRLEYSMTNALASLYHGCRKRFPADALASPLRVNEQRHARRIAFVHRLLRVIWVIGQHVA